jgi:glycosyltransferase involved in cell wall biosynthesis
MTLPVVSIVLPVWNPQPEWVNAAIDSAFHESRCRIEVVLVDDGSDRRPESWLSEQNARRTRIITTPHRGVVYARNAALRHCSGDFIRFLDGDDLILPESTSALAVAAFETGSPVTYGSTVLTDSELRKCGMLSSRLRGWIHLQTALGLFDCTLPALLIPRRIVDRVGGFDERLVIQEDWDFVLRVSEAVEFRGIDRPVYIYRRNEMSSTYRAARRHAVRSTAIIIKGYLARHPELDGTRPARKLRAYAQFLIARLKDPAIPMRSRRFWRATAADPLRGTGIAAARIAALGRTKAQAVTRAAHLIVSKRQRL